MVSACCTQPAAPVSGNTAVLDAPAPDAVVQPQGAAQVAQGLSQKDYDDADNIAQLTMFEIALHSRDLPTAAAIARDMAQSKRDLEMAKRAWVLYTLLHDRDQALQAAITWRDIDPGSKDAQIQYLFAQASLGHYTPLIRELRKQLDSRGPSFEARLDMAAGLAQRIGDPGVGLAVFEQVTSDLTNLNSEEQSALDLYHAAFASEAGDFDRAISFAQKASTDPRRRAGAIILMLHIADGPQRMSILSQASRYLDEHPDNEAVRTAYVEALSDGGLWDTALQEIDKLIKAFPDKSQYTYHKAYMLTQAGRYPEALNTVKDFEVVATKRLSALTKLARKDPSSVEQQLQMLQAAGLAPETESQEEQAEPEAPVTSLTERESIETGLKNLRVLYFEAAAELRGSIYNAQGEPQKAIEQYKLIQSPDSRPTALLEIAGAYASEQKYDEALKTLDEITEDSPAYLSALRSRAVIYRTQSQWDKTADILGDIRRHGVKELDIILFHAEALGYLGRWDEVDSEYHTALELHPNDSETYNSYGFTLADRDTQLDAAQSLLDRALAMEPGSQYIWDSYGWLQYRLGNFDLAKAYLEMAWSRDPDIAEIAAHLAELYQALNNTAKAREYLKKAQAIDPEDRAVKNAVKVLNSPS